LKHEQSARAARTLVFKAVCRVPGLQYRLEYTDCSRKDEKMSMEPELLYTAYAEYLGSTETRVYRVF
jgi:hypothetical protein